MGEQVSTAGHGPARGYSGMLPNLDKFLAQHETPGRKVSRRRAAFGPQAPRPKSLLDRNQEAAEALLAYLKDGRARLDSIICDVESGIAIAQKIRAG